MSLRTKHRPARAGLIFLLVLAGFQFAVAASAELPEIPEIALAGALPPIREQILKAREGVFSEPESAAANGQLAMVLTAYNFVDAALVAYQRARLLDPSEFAWAYYRGSLLLWSGRYPEAIAELRAALKLEPERVDARIKLARALLEQGEVAESRSIFELVVREHPDQIAGQYGLGRILVEADKLAEARGRFQSALALNDRIGEIHYSLAMVLRRQGDEAGARRHLALYERYQDNKLEHYDPAMIAISRLHKGDRPHMLKARQHFLAGQYTAAVDELNQALAINPDNDAAHVHLVWLYGRLGQSDLAGEHYQRALGINPDSAQLHFNWGELLRREGKYPEAAEAFERTLELEPQNVNARVQLGFTLEQTGQSERAAEQYRSALEIDPEHRNARFLLGKNLALQGRNREAIEQIRQALEPEDGRAPLFLRTLAGVYLNMGDYGRAEESLQRARRLAAGAGNQAMEAGLEADLRRVEEARRSEVATSETR